MRLVVDDTFNRIQKLILSRTVVNGIKMNISRTREALIGRENAQRG